MIVRTLFTAALFVRLAALVAAVPQHFLRAQSCVATITATATVTVTLAATGRATTSASNPNGVLQPVTVTVTKTLVSTQTVVQTQKVTLSQTITETRTVTQTVTHTNIQTINNNAYGSGNGQQSGLATAVTPLSTQVSIRTGIPLTPSSRPYYGNVTDSGSYLNSTSSTDPAPSSETVSFSLSPYSRVSTTVSPAPSQQSSNSAPAYSSSSTSYSSGYENALYFANWYVTSPPMKCKS